MKQHSIAKKFSAVVIVFLITLSIVFATGMMGMHRIMDSSAVIIKNVAMTRILSSQIIGQMTQVGVDLRDSMLIDDHSRRKELDQSMQSGVAEIEASLKELDRLKDDDNRAFVDTAAKDFVVWKEFVKSSRAHLLDGKLDEAKRVMSEATEERESLAKNIRDANKQATEEMEQSVNDNEALFKRLVDAMILISLIGLALGAGLAAMVIRNVVKAVNLSVATLIETSKQVAAAATEVSQSSQSIAQAATEQASSLEETSSAIEEMNSMVGRNSESARSSSAVTRRSVASAERGQVVVQSMLRSMNDIHEANRDVMRETEESHKRFQDIVMIIHAIGEKTKVIHEIVFQTKLLSFNAAVEAARAGEHGKGFAVVADEVGNLAQMSGSAAKEISTLLESSIDKVQTIVKDSSQRIDGILRRTTDKVDAGGDVAKECSAVLSELAASVGNVSQMADSIAEASEEQSRGIEEINKAVVQLDQVTQVNAAASEQAASASEQLSAQAVTMRNVVEDLARIVNGGTRQLPVEAKEEPFPIAGPIHRSSNVLQWQRDSKAKPGAGEFDRKIQKIS